MANRGGYPPGGYDPGFNHALQQLRAEFEQKLNGLGGAMRGQNGDIIRKVNELSAVTSALRASRSGGGYPIPGARGVSGQHPIWEARHASGPRLIEDIPGRRVPYVLVIDIAIDADETATREGSVTISQEGPFVAVKRWATFQSAYEFQVTDPVSNAIGSFSGRSFGRYRPIHSVCDVFDGQHNATGDTSQWFLAALQNPGAIATAELPGGTLGLPSSMSSFRTMEFDGRISVINAGSSYPRQNISIPSAFWAADCNTPVTLGALDFFERGEVITLRCQPNHVNNPPAGNVTGDAVFPERVAPAAGGWPFADGQYDAHEGIATADPATIGQVGPPIEPSLLVTDSVQRLPQGIATFIWEGYRIIQPVGPVG